MKVLVPLQSNVFEEQAHVNTIFKTCESLSNQGTIPVLLIPLGVKTFFGKKETEEGLLQKYNVKHKFEVAGVPVFRSRNPPFPFSKINGLAFAIYSNLYVMVNSPDFVLTRDIGFCRLFVKLKKLGLFRKIKLGYEVHSLHSMFESDPEKKKQFRELEDEILSAADVVVVLMAPVAKILEKRGVDPKKMAIAPVGVDLSLFENLDKKKARENLGIEKNQKIVLYAGHLYPWKGVYDLALAMKEVNAECWMLGGREEDIAKMKSFLDEKKITNVILKGRVRPMQVPEYVSAADVAVVPSPSKDPESKSKDQELLGFGTPMKLLEYIAAKTPVVVTDVPAHRQILGQTSAVIVKPDSPKSLAAGIKSALSNPTAGYARAKKAYLQIAPFDWQKRAIPILEKLKLALVRPAAVKKEKPKV